MLQNEEKLKYVVLAKVTHPDIATGLNPNIRITQEDVKAFFDDQTVI